MRTSAKLQSAMEYLMTYGWAILVIAIVLGVLYYFGVFGGAASGNACIAGGGYLCSRPLLNSTGYLSINFAVAGSPITITGINCTANTTTPAQYQTLAPTVLQSGNIASINVKCVGAAGPIGKKYSGYIWINYTSGAQKGLYARAALIQASVSSVGNLPAAGIGFNVPCNQIITSNIVVASIPFSATISYTMYGGGGGGGWPSNSGAPGSVQTGSFNAVVGNSMTIYVGGGGGDGTGGSPGGGSGGGGSGYYGGGGGGYYTGYNSSGGGGGSSAILYPGNTLVQYAAGGNGGYGSYGSPGGGGGGGSNAGGSGGTGSSAGNAGSFNAGGTGGANTGKGGSAGTGGVTGYYGGGGGGYGAGGGGYNSAGGSNGGNGNNGNDAGCISYGGIGGSTGAGGSSGVCSLGLGYADGGNGGSVNTYMERSFFMHCLMPA